MQLKRILSDDDAVSPVIGVILMVAITVILAAVIATFVLGLGEQVSSTAPTASFTFEYNEDDSGGTGVLTITHDGGDAVKANELYLRGQDTEPSSSSSNVNVEWLEIDSSSTLTATDVTASGEIGSDSAVVAGDFAEVDGVGSASKLRMIYNPSQGDNTATLSTFEGPDA